MLLEEKLENETEDEDEEIEQWVVVGLLIWLGAQEARQWRAERRLAHKTYLMRPELMYNRHLDTPWQKLYNTRNGRAFITTMGFDFTTFSAILDADFEEAWDSNPISRIFRLINRMHTSYKHVETRRRKLSSKELARAGRWSRE